MGESEKKYRALIENSVAGICQIDGLGKFAYVNKAFAKIVGYRQEELIGKHYGVVIPHHKAGEISRSFKKILNAKNRKERIRSGEFTVLTKKGRRLPVQYSFSLIKLEEKINGTKSPIIKNQEGKSKYLICTIVDVDKYRKAEKKAADLAIRYQELYDNIPVAYFGVGTNGRINMANKAAQKLTSYPLDQLKKMKVFELYAEESKDQARYLFSEFKKKGIIQNEKLTFKRRDGEKREILLNVEAIRSEKGRIVASRSLVVDITKQKEMEDELRRRAETITDLELSLGQGKIPEEAILKSIGDGVVATDTEGKIVMVNKTTEALFGLKLKDVFGKSALDVLPFIEIEGSRELLIPKEKRPIFAALSSGNKVTSDISRKLYIKNKYGQNIPVEITAAPIRLNEKSIGAIMVIRDISKDREIDQAKSEFVALASHQLRTPMTIIKLYSQLFMERESLKSLSEQQYQYLKEIDEANQRMIRLVDAFLSVSKIDLGVLENNPRPMNLIKCIEDIIEDFQKTLSEKGLFLSRNYDSGLELINFDSKLIGLIFENLFSNAVKYTPRGQKISVTIKKEPTQVIIEVTDTGYGIPENQQARIFSKMFRAENVVNVNKEGTGLGLYTAKSVVEKMGGKIWFQSAQNKGTTFYVNLPCCL